MTRKKLITIYDCINWIAARHEAQGRDRSEWFLTDSEFEKIKRDKRYTIL